MTALPEERAKRERACRQAASLFALTTSGMVGEAQTAKEKVKAIVTTHRLTFAEVCPYSGGNEVALRVMRHFRASPRGA